MALPSSGSLSIKSAATSARSISLEVDGNETGNKSLTTLSTTAGKGAPHSILEFYSYSGAGSGCSGAPNDPTAASANVVSNDVTVSWTPDNLGEDTVQYRIERASSSAPGTWVFIANVTFGTNSYSDNNVPSGQYTYRVRAENACGESTYRNTSSVIVP